MARVRFLAFLVFALTATWALTACARPSRCGAPNSTARVSNDIAPMSSPPCNEQRVAAKLIVLAVERLDESASQHIRAALAERYNQGLFFAAAGNDLVTILARTDSDINVANTVGFLQTIGIQAREATEQEYQAAESALTGRTIGVSASAVSLDEQGPSRHDAGDSPLRSLDASLDSLRDRFNRDKGKLRFVAILSPT